jgi:hypothetical protein
MGAIQYTSSFDVTIPFSDECRQFNLQQNNAQTYTIPGDGKNKYSALFAYTADSNVFVSLNGTATSPAINTNTDTRRLEFRPDKRYVSGGDVLSLVTPDANAYVGVSLRTIPS